MNYKNAEPLMNKRLQYQPLIENLTSVFGNRLKSIVLFGSQARSKSMLQRDHDIFIVLEQLPKNPLQRLKEIRKPVMNIPLQINIIAKTPEEVESNLTPLLLEICVDGVCLFGESYFESYRKRGLRALKQSGLKRRRVGREWYWQFEKFPQKEWELTWDGYRELP
jgi:predicted nucleotidyltransferase